MDNTVRVRVDQLCFGLLRAADAKRVSAERGGVLASVAHFPGLVPKRNQILQP